MILRFAEASDAIEIVYICIFRITWTAIVLLNSRKRLINFMIVVNMPLQSERCKISKYDFTYLIPLDIKVKTFSRKVYIVHNLACYHLTLTIYISIVLQNNIELYSVVVSILLE